MICTLDTEKIMKNMLWMLLLTVSYSQAATIAVIDSGVDVQHTDLSENIWMNTLEIADNGRDEDGNGYQDDVYGWNFAGSNNLVIDRKYLGTFSDDPKTFFDIQAKSFLGTATAAEKKWVNAKRKNKKFLKEMGIFGNFVHGTHVAGITVKDTNHKILSVKLIPTEVNPFKNQARDLSMFAGAEEDGFRMKLLKGLLATLATEQMKMMEEIATYVGDHKADIANGSFGTGFGQAKMITNKLFKIAFQRDPSKTEADKLAKYFLNTMIKEGRKMVDAAPNTLFVFAAGNSNSNNDKFPTSPTNIKSDNVISVAATYKYEYLAPFSNYGKTMVDIAAPGMIINSQIPGNDYLKVSGTSQAAPMIANIAAGVKDANPGLTPGEIKEILMGTVDEKGYLSEKVLSGGIANTNRALHAAKLSLTMSLSTAISEAKVSVQDIKVERTKSMRFPEAIIPIPLPSMFQ